MFSQIISNYIEVFVFFSHFNLKKTLLKIIIFVLMLG